MPIPDLNTHGLLPTGVHDCTIPEIETSFGWNSHRVGLLEGFKDFLTKEINGKFACPVYFDGSFVTDKDEPEDIDVVLELSSLPDAVKYQGLVFMQQHQSRLMKDYRVHFWINLPGSNDLCSFFQYIGAKTAKFKGLHPKFLKGILRLS